MNKSQNLAKTVADLRDTLYNLAVATEEGKKALDELCRLATRRPAPCDGAEKSEDLAFLLAGLDHDAAHGLTTEVAWARLRTVVRELCRRALSGGE